jgi:hypothetical protein
MSGIEVVGLALGLWPVMENIIGLYKASKDGSAIRTMGMTIKTYELIFKQSVSKLLQANESLTDKDRMGLLNGEEDFAGLWKDAEFKSRLERRLGPELFLVLEHKTESIVELLKTLQKKIEPKTPGGPPGLAESLTWKTVSSSSTARSIRDNLHLPKDPVRSMKLFLQRDDIKKNMESLKQHVQELRTILEPVPMSTYSAEKTPERQPGHGRSDSGEQKRKIDAQFFDDFYKVLDQSFRCQCEIPHECNLRISDSLQVMFPVEHGGRSLSTGSEELARTRSLTIDSHVTALPTDLEEIDSSRYGDSAVLARSPTLTALGSDANRSTWSRSKHGSSSSTSSEHRALMLFFSPTRGVQDLATISDLCQFVRTLRSEPPDAPSPGHKGMLYQGGMRYTVIAPRSRDPLSTTTIISLDDCLSNCYGYGMRKQERLEIALNLASAIGWFYPTSWIEKTWTWRSFSVIRGEQGEAMDQLCITRRFYSPEAAKQNAMAQQSRFWHTMRLQLDPMLVRLGFALIELAMGQRLSDIRSAANGGQEDEGVENEALKDMEDYNTAVTLLDDGIIKDNISLPFHTIVSACVKCSVLEDEGMRPLTSTSPTFDDDLEKFVVGPLRKYNLDTWGQPGRLAQIRAF